MHYELSHFYLLVVLVIPYFFCPFFIRVVANFVAVIRLLCQNRSE